MKQPVESCRCVLDWDKQITRWVCQGLKTDGAWLDNFLTIGIVSGNNLVGGVIFHNVRRGIDLSWTIYTIDKRWCTRRILKTLFEMAFEVLQAKRINLLVSTNNVACLKLVEKLGFKREGLLRAYREDGSDCYFYGMLKSENKWKGKTNE